MQRNVQWSDAESPADWQRAGPNELLCPSSAEGAHIVCGFKFAFQTGAELKRRT